VDSNQWKSVPTSLLPEKARRGINERIMSYGRTYSGKISLKVCVVPERMGRIQEEEEEEEEEEEVAKTKAVGFALKKFIRRHVKS
jgi:hypothetical protein